MSNSSNRFGNQAKKRSRATFDKIARDFERTMAGRHSRKSRAAVLNVLDRDTGAFLDVGCGPGLLLDAVASGKPRFALCGVDLSVEMAGIAAERLGARARVVVGDAEALPFENSTFDVVTCVDSFHHYPNAAAALGEMARVMKPGGRLIVADPWAPGPLRGLLNIVLPLARRGDVRVYGRDEMTTLLAPAGLVLERWVRHGWHAFVMLAGKPPTDF